MTPAAHGRYCDACEKVVVDFSHMSDAELVNFVAARSAERVCGRFRPEQLSQPRAAAPLANLTTWGVWLATVAVMLSISSCEMVPLAVGEPSLKQVAPATEFVAVRGYVTDRITHKPLAQAHITCLEDTTHQVRSEADGSFELLLPTQLMGSKLRVTADGAPNNNYSARIIDITPKLAISLLPLEPIIGQVRHDNFMMGDTVIVSQPTAPPPPPPLIGKAQMAPTTHSFSRSRLH